MKTKIKPLIPPDSHHLQAAEGWLELGNHLEANEELENISPLMRVHPDVLVLRWQIYSQGEKWEACQEIARTLTEIMPDQSFGWIHLAYSVRRISNGTVQMAYESLLPAAEKFPKEWIIPYNLACYCSQLERFDDATSWFKQAMALDEKTVRTIGIDDPDLLPLWDSMSGTLWKAE